MDPRGTCLNPPAVRLQTNPPFGGKPPRWSACISLALELDLKVSQQLFVAQTTETLMRYSQGAAESYAGSQKALGVLPSCAPRCLGGASQVVLVVKNLLANAGDVKRLWFDPWIRMRRVDSLEKTLMLGGIGGRRRRGRQRM